MAVLTLLHGCDNWTLLKQREETLQWKWKFCRRNVYRVPVLVAARSKEWVCGHLPAEIMVSKPIGGMDVCRDCCVLSGRGPCDELITRPEESYRLWYVFVCHLEASWMRRPWPTGRLLCQIKKKYIQSVAMLPVTIFLLFNAACQGTFASLCILHDEK